MKLLFGAFLSGRWGAALLVLRVVTGAAFVLHGWAKIQGPGGMFGWMGKDMPGILQFLAAFAEFGGGLGLIFGVLTPIAAFGICFTMLVAYFKAFYPNAPFVAAPGTKSFEIVAVYFASSLAILLAGPGAFSLDALIFGRPRLSDVQGSRTTA